LILFFVFSILNQGGHACRVGKQGLGVFYKSGGADVLFDFFDMGIEFGFQFLYSFRVLIGEVVTFA